MLESVQICQWKLLLLSCVRQKNMTPIAEWGLPRKSMCENVRVLVKFLEKETFLKTSISTCQIFLAVIFRKKVERKERFCRLWFMNTKTLKYNIACIYHIVDRQILEIGRIFILDRLVFIGPGFNRILSKFDWFYSQSFENRIGREFSLLSWIFKALLYLSQQKTNIRKFLESWSNFQAHYLWSKPILFHLNLTEIIIFAWNTKCLHFRFFANEREKWFLSTLIFLLKWIFRW